MTSDDATLSKLDAQHTTRAKTSDQVIISGLKVEAVIGIHAWERAITQPLLIDVIMYTDNSRASQTDDIVDAINYQQVCADIGRWCVEAKAGLIERLAGLIADNLMQNEAITGVEVQVAKPTAIPEADYVAVRTVR